MFTLEDLGVNPENANRQSFTDMIPPTKTLEDGTLEIIDWVKGVTLSGYTYEEDRDRAVFTFKDKNGGTIRKYIQDPSTRPHILRMDDDNPKKKEQINFTYIEVKNLFNSFVKPGVVTKALSEMAGKQITFQDYTKNLFELLSEPANLNANEVWLKLAFQYDKGVKPRYSVPQKNYLGNAGWEPKWTTDNKDANWNDKKNFTFEEKSDDFATPNMNPIAAPPAMNMGINEVFGTPTPTLNTPTDVTFLD